MLLLPCPPLAAPSMLRSCGGGADAADVVEADGEGVGVVAREAVDRSPGMSNQYSEIAVHGCRGSDRQAASVHRVSSVKAL